MSFSIKGWCPGALRPMASGDGLVVRVRAPNGRLTHRKASGIAALARECGNGLLDVTNRANLQIRGVTPETHPRLLDGLRALDLLDDTPEAEARRNVMLSPLAGFHSAEWVVAEEIARAMSRPDAPRVPGKFGFAVDTGAGSLVGADYDIYLIADGGWQIFAAGYPFYAQPPGVVSDPREAARCAVELARWFVDSGGVRDGRGRMRAHVQSGVAPPPILCHRRDAITYSVPAYQVGPRPGVGFFYGLPFGQITAAQLDALAQLGTLRLTHERMMMVERLDDGPPIAGLITDRDDPLLRIVACTGAPACVQAHGDMRALGRELAGVLPPGLTLHLSGCDKRCASRVRHDFTIVAGPDGVFTLQSDGRSPHPAPTARLRRDELAGRIAEAPRPARIEERRLHDRLVTLHHSQTESDLPYALRL